MLVDRTKLKNPDRERESSLNSSFSSFFFLIHLDPKMCYLQTPGGRRFQELPGLVRVLVEREVLLHAGSYSRSQGATKRKSVDKKEERVGAFANWKRKV